MFAFHRLFWTFTAVVFARFAQADERPPSNILLLYADDWRYDTLGCAGNPIVKTPELDRLAGESIRFTHACVTTSICGVSRASLLTGQWMSRHGNRAFNRFKTPWAETLPGILRAQGFWVGHVGKWHFGKFPAEEFDFARAYSGTHWVKEPDGSWTHVTARNERDALEFLRTRPKERPFFLTVAFFATHAEDPNPLQYLPQPWSEDLYSKVTVPVPHTAGDDFFHRLPPFLARDTNEGRRRWGLRFDTPEKYQRSMKNYYRMASEVDAACGHVLEELKRSGELDRTLVIFTTDNGYFHGEHGLADKWYPYEESIRVPLMVRDPRLPATARGSTRDDFVLNVDLAPTMLKAVGATVPATMQGRDFSPLYLASEKPAWRQEFYYEHPTIKNVDFIPSSEALVQRDWKLVRWPDFKTEELFDLKADPLEEHNIVADPANAGRIEAMRTRMAELRDAAH